MNTVNEKGDNSFFKSQKFKQALSKKGWIIAGCILLFFVICNPSLEDFRSYLHLGSARYYEGTGRDINFLIGSIYSQNTYGAKKKYLGVLKNFIDISSNPNANRGSSDSDTTKKADTAISKMADTNDTYQKSLKLKKLLACTAESAKGDFLSYMKFNYPDYKIYGEPVVREQDDCVYEIQFTTRKQEDYAEKEVVIAQISYDYDYSHYYFKTIRGVLY